MKSRVFAVGPVDKDLSGVSQFGELVYLYDPGEPRASVWDPSYVVEALDRLQDHGFNQHYDFVLAAGGTVPTVLFCSAVAQRYPSARALLYDYHARRYCPRRLTTTTITTVTSQEVRHEPETGVVVPGNPAGAREAGGARP
jgi:hypothetical protein